MAAQEHGRSLIVSCQMLSVNAPSCIHFTWSKLSTVYLISLKYKLSFHLILPFRELLMSVQFDRSRFWGFWNRIGSSEPFLPQRFRNAILKKKEPSVTNGLTDVNNSRNGNISEIQTLISLDISEIQTLNRFLCVILEYAHTLIDSYYTHSRPHKTWYFKCVHTHKCTYVHISVVYIWRYLCFA